MSSRSRTKALLAVLCIVPIVSSEQAWAHAPAASPPRDAAVPDGLTASDWSGILAAREAARYEVIEGAGGHRACNPRQQWTTRFDGRGFTIDAGSWSFGLELRRWGFDEYERTAGETTGASVEGGRLTYVWGEGLSEWYVNDARGVEHGYTVRERPLGHADEPGPLTFTLAVRGGLRGEVLSGGRGARFADGAGRTLLTYAGLTVLDAEGRSLPARMECAGELLRLSVDERDARYPLTVDPLAQQAYLKASNTDGNDYFGGIVSVSGDTVVVGASREDSSSTGVNGDQGDNSSVDSGGAYVLVRSGTSWAQQAYLKASNTGSDDSFGSALSVSGDTVVVGALQEDSNSTGVNGDESSNSAPNSGSVYVFVRSGTSWSQQAYLKASNTGLGDRFGFSVAVSGDTIVVGAPEEDSSSTGVNGDQGDDGSSNGSGAAYVFVRSGTSWSQEAYLKASNTDRDDLFGRSVAVSGDTVVVATSAEDSGSTGVNGDQGNDDAFGSGAAYVFVRSGTSWSQQAYLKASNTAAFDAFGASVSVSGDTVVVGASGEDSSSTGANGDQLDNGAQGSGAAYVFRRNGTSWSQEAYLKASNTGAGDTFGVSASVSGDTVVVGALQEDSSSTGRNGDQGNDGAADSGASYLFVRSGTTWSQQAYLKASNTEEGDRFGVSSSVSGATVVVGALFEDGGSTGVNGDESDNGAFRSGAAYVFSVLPESFCDAADGALASCPCANPGAPDSGCDIQQGTGGVALTVVAQETSPQNRVTWSGAGFPAAFFPTSIVIRAPGLDAGGPQAFGDGLRCIGTPLVRLAATFASGGSVTHSHGHGAGPGGFYYQLWFRNTPAMYCTSDAFNLSNGRTLVW